MLATPKVWVCISNRNSREHLEYCLPTLAQTTYSNYDVVLVDNASTDDSIAYVERKFPGIVLIKNAEDRGWAGGTNVGIRYALQHGALYVALLSADVKVDPRWLTEAVRVVEERLQVGCVGFKVFNEYRDEDRDGRQFEAAMATWQGLEVTGTKHIAGCALFIRTEVFEHIGFFDEVYMSYGEEDDFEKRAMRAGHKMVRVNVPIWHHSMGYWSKMSLQASKLAIRNTLRCSIKNDNLWGVWKTFLLVCSVACNPFSKADRIYFHYRRLRRSNVFVNCPLLMYGIFWNGIFLPRTLAIRRAEAERVAGAHRALEEMRG